MLPKENRLSADFDYRRLRRFGRRFGSSRLTLLVLADRRFPTRFGFVVSSRVSNLATRRNRIKRILRAAARSLFPRVVPGTQAAVGVRSGALSASPEELRRELQEILIKAGVYH